MSYYEDVYSQPERYGLRVVAEMSWSDEAYQFDITVAWQAENGTLYWGDDAGCSCPSPFENVNSLDELQSGTPHELAAKIEDRLRDLRESASSYRSDREMLATAEPQAVEFLAKVMDVTP